MSSVELVNYANATSTGTRMPRTNWHDLSNFEIVLPPEEVANVFGKLITPMLSMIKENIMQLHPLSSQRDSLLRKLMSGKIRVNVKQLSNDAKKAGLLM